MRWSITQVFNASAAICISQFWIKFDGFGKVRNGIGFFSGFGIGVSQAIVDFRKNAATVQYLNSARNFQRIFLLFEFPVIAGGAVLIAEHEGLADVVLCQIGHYRFTVRQLDQAGRVFFSNRQLSAGRLQNIDHFDRQPYGIAEHVQQLGITQILGRFSLYNLAQIKIIRIGRRRD